MATRGYAATSINDIRKACGLPPSSIYWHFGSKEGVLAAVMARGADRFFAAIPTSEDAEGQLAALSRLPIAAPGLPAALLHAVAGAQQRSGGRRGDTPRPRHRYRRFRDAITQLLPADAPPSKAERVVTELTALAVAISDGCSSRPPRTRHRCRTDVPAAVGAVTALIPILLEEK